MWPEFPTAYSTAAALLEYWGTLDTVLSVYHAQIQTHHHSELLKDFDMMKVKGEEEKEGEGRRQRLRHTDEHNQCIFTLDQHASATERRLE